MAENQVQNPPAEKVITLSASLLEPFQGHPFRVASGEEMEQLIAQVIDPLPGIVSCNCNIILSRIKDIKGLRL